MARTIVIGGDNAPDPDVVILFDQKFTVRRITRSVQKALEKVEPRIAEEFKDPDGDSDKLVSLLAEGIDALLAPDGHAKHAKAVLTGAWKDDRLGIDDLADLYNGLQNTKAEDRPTSASAT